MSAAPRHSPSKAAVHQRADGHVNGSTTGVDNIWKACAYGDHDKLLQLAEQQPELINQVDGRHDLSPPPPPLSLQMLSPYCFYNAVMQADEQGYRPLQWAALNNRVPCCTYLLEHGAEVKACVTPV
jgi:palmitoyltransferase ZDHHC13/17